MKIQKNLKFLISLIYYIYLIYYISQDMFSFGRSGRFCQKIHIVKNSTDFTSLMKLTDFP